jgi:hypothetical protein
MQKIQRAIRESFRVRAGLAAIVVTVAAFVGPSPVHSKALFLPQFLLLPPLLLGAIIGLLTYSRKQWIIWTLASLTILTPLTWFGIEDFAERQAKAEVNAADIAAAEKWDQEHSVADGGVKPKELTARQLFEMCAPHDSQPADALAGCLIVSAASAAHAVDEATMRRICASIPMMDLKALWNDDQLEDVLCSATLSIAVAQMQGNRNLECETAHKAIYDEAVRRGRVEAARLKCKERLQRK